MLPRDWYKTTIASISYPIWLAINNPEVKILLVQNTYANAVKKLGAIKKIFEENELFRACYPDIIPDNACTWQKDSLCIKRKKAYAESTFEAAGTNTNVVSRHYDVIIEDDTVAPEFDHMTGIMMQPTRAQVEKAIGWHKLATPLLVEPAESIILVVGTRWVEDDLLEWIMKNEKHYTIMQRAVREGADGLPDPNGTITWPETDDGRPKFNEEVLDQLQAALGPYMFATLYLNCPTAAANMLFHPTWITYYNNVNMSDLLCFTSMDLASADEHSSSDPDYTTILTCGINPNNCLIYVLDYDRGRYNPGEQVELLFEHFRKYNFLNSRVEAIGYQRTLAYWLNQRMEKLGVFFPVEEIRSHSASKEARIRGLQPYFMARRIFIREEMNELENELINFPYGRHDDLIDALSMQIPDWATTARENYSDDRKKEDYLKDFTASSLLYSIQKEQQKGPPSKFDSFGLTGLADRGVVRTKNRMTFTRNVFVN